MLWLSQITIGNIEISPSGLWAIVGAIPCLLELLVPRSGSTDSDDAKPTWAGTISY